MTAIHEQFVNRWTTTLAASMTVDQLTVVLTTVVGLPASGQMRFLLGSSSAGEKIVATLNGTATLVCTRGAEGTTAATHSAAEVVTAILTAGGVNNLADWIRQSIVVNAGEVVTHDGEVVYL